MSLGESRRRRARASACPRARSRRRSRGRVSVSTVARDVKPVRAEAHEILIARAARRSQDLQIVDRLEQIRLSLAVLADDDETRRPAARARRARGCGSRARRGARSRAAARRSRARELRGALLEKRARSFALVVRRGEQAERRRLERHARRRAADRSPRSRPRCSAPTASGPFARIVCIIVVAVAMQLGRRERRDSRARCETLPARRSSRR